MQRKYLYLAVAIVIIIIAAVLISALPNSQKSTGLESYDNMPVPQSLISQLRVPDSVSNAVNVSRTESNGVVAKLTMTGINATALKLNGKPEVLYIGAEYCPFCAAERWAMIVALLRFGNFTNLRYMTSSATDIDPNTPTFTFYNSTYTSPYIAFVPVETTTNKVANSSYKGPTILGYPALQQINSSQGNIMSTYDSGGSIPFIDIANTSVQVGASYNPALVVDGLNWSQIAADINNPSTVQSQAIVSAANLFTAQICMADGNRPASVCSQQYVTVLEKG
ncbi:MAG: DUF929 family protein [Candidatus Micrarchaeaceae archaeon]